ncbi:DUF1990 family protein [Streptomyces sp. 7N604]|uniref:DUF1990 family protein n=1 Tax=Streptomyces sp. 7N604 TaxID=3457415 RepID=UPI003FD45F68
MAEHRTGDLDRRYRRACEQQPTYPESLAGATLGGPLPSGYAHVRRRVRLGEGPGVFARAAAYVMGWGAQRGAGFAVYPQSPPVTGATALVVVRPPGPRLPGLRLPRLVVPCRVVAVVAGEDRAGFAYGTLPGHPECGEEAFTVVRDGQGTVWFEVTAFSRPATWYTRLGGPAGRLIQRAAVTRYLWAVAAAVGAAGGGR